MEKSNNNYNLIDLFKLIMVICVVAIHTNPLYKDKWLKKHLREE